MYLPVQAAPVIRDISDINHIVKSVGASVICELVCEALPEPAKSICKQLC